MQESGHSTDPPEAGDFQGEQEPIGADAPLEPSRLPGPGLPEVVLWIFAFWALQLGMLIMLVIVIMVRAGGPGDFDFNALPATAKLMLFGSSLLLTFLVLIPAGCWRMSPHPGRRLNLSLPTLPQLILAMSLVVPLTVLVDTVFKQSELLHTWLAERYPVLDLFQGTDVHELLGELKGAPLPLILFFVAVVPAVGEEFLFRGLIGRGLVARWGLVAGVGITSVLFAAVHLYPPHVLAVLPVGIVLHILYLTTRSFWTPVLFHLANNSLASLSLQGEQEVAPLGLYWHLLAAGYTLLCLSWLVRIRTRYVDREGFEADLPYPTAEAPPPSLAKRAWTPPTWMPLTVGTGVLAVSIMLAVHSLLEQ
jgi:uncharacterized protein